MKTDFLRQKSLVAALSLIGVLGCANPSASNEQPQAVQSTTVTTVQAVSPTNAPAGAADTNAPAISAELPPSPPPTDLKLSAPLAEVIKLVQSGVAEEVILAYINQSKENFDLGSDQIVYLNDLGVSTTVMTAMLRHDGAPDPEGQVTNVVAAAEVKALPPEASLTQTQMVSNLPPGQPVVTQEVAEPQPQSVPTTTTTTTTTYVVPPPVQQTEVAYYYDTLSPYGSWVHVAGYGWCWRPTVAVAVPSWRPYCDGGRWLWSDVGWYWHSDYSWGWAPFHYGRWYNHHHAGWVWHPGTVWGPAWVSWRYHDGYCGWAPLPPEAHWVSGFGFTYYGRHVSVGFDFGLHHRHYSFVSLHRFHNHRPRHHLVHERQQQNIYRNSTVVNNYIVGNNNTVINRGIGRDTVAQATRSEIPKVTIREAAGARLASGKAERLQKEGNDLVLYRPQLPKNPPVLASRAAANGTRTEAGKDPATAPTRSKLSMMEAPAGTKPAELSSPSKLNRPLALGSDTKPAESASAVDAVKTPVGLNTPTAPVRPTPRTEKPAEVLTQIPGKGVSSAAKLPRNEPGKVETKPLSAKPAPDINAAPRTVTPKNETPLIIKPNRQEPASILKPTVPNVTSAATPPSTRAEVNAGPAKAPSVLPKVTPAPAARPESSAKLTAPAPGPSAPASQPKPIIMRPGTAANGVNRSASPPPITQPTPAAPAPSFKAQPAPTAPAPSFKAQPAPAPAAPSVSRSIPAAPSAQPRTYSPPAAVPSRPAPAPAPSVRPTPAPAPTFRAAPAAPAYRAPAPAPAPSYRAPAPAPSYRAPAPAPAPSYRAPAPAPSYRAPAPAPAPSYRAPAPQMSRPTPAPAPSFSRPSPAPSGERSLPGRREGR